MNRNIIHLCSVVLLAAAMSVQASIERDVVRVGDSATEVQRVLGKPDGYLKIESLEMLYYPRGKVEVRDGVVVDVDLISPAALEARQREARLARERRIAEARVERERRIEQGLALRERLRDDPDFALSSAQHQVSTWETFQDSYPGVNVESEYSAALQQLRAQARRREAEQRAREVERERERELLNLQARVAEAEARAREAERDALRAEDDARRSRERTVYVASPTYVAPYPGVTHTTVVDKKHGYRSHHGQRTVTECRTTPVRTVTPHASFTRPFAYDRSYYSPTFSTRGRTYIRSRSLTSGSGVSGSVNFRF